MKIPEQIAAHILALELDLKGFEFTLEHLGPDALRVQVAKEELDTALNHLWAPRFLAYVEKCRKSNPTPDIGTLGAREWAMFDLYCSKIASYKYVADWSRRTSHQSIVCELPVLGILAARSQWPGKLSNCILLTSEEWRNSYDVYSLRDGWPPWPRERWWACEYNWAIERPPAPLPEGWGLVPELVDPSDKDYWIYREGYYQDELASHVRIELLEWDGASLKLVRVIAEIMS